MKEKAKSLSKLYNEEDELDFQTTELQTDQPTELPTETRHFDTETLQDLKTQTSVGVPCLDPPDPDDQDFLLPDAIKMDGYGYQTCGTLRSVASSIAVAIGTLGPDRLLDPFLKNELERMRNNRQRDKISREIEDQPKLQKRSPKITNTPNFFKDIADTESRKFRESVMLENASNFEKRDPHLFDSKFESRKDQVYSPNRYKIAGELNLDRKPKFEPEEDIIEPAYSVRAATEACSCVDTLHDDRLNSPKPPIMPLETQNPEKMLRFESKESYNHKRTISQTKRFKRKRINSTILGCTDVSCTQIHEKIVKEKSKTKTRLFVKHKSGKFEIMAGCCSKDTTV